MMISNVISKNKVIVQDDFFDDLVNGLKSPIEESIEKQDVKNSRVSLGGKQLALFKNKVTPIIGKKIRENKMVYEYMQQMSNSYEQKKIQQMHNEFVEAFNEYAIINDEADDEIEEINNDKKGHQLFLYQGFKFLGTIRKLKTFYDLIVKMKSLVKPREQSNEFNFDEWKNSINDEEMTNSLLEYMGKESERFIPALISILESATNGIYKVSQKGFKQINNAIYREIRNMLIQAAIEAGASVILASVTGGGSLAGLAKAGLTITNMMRKIGNFLSVGLKFTEISNKIYKMGRVGRGVIKLGEKSLNVIGKTGKFVVKHPKEFWSGYKIARKGMQIYDIIDVDEDDLEEVFQWAKRTTQPLKHTTMAQMQRVISDYETVESVNEMYKGISKKLNQNIKLKLHTPSSNIQDKYATKIRIKNLNFDFGKIEELSQKFKHIGGDFKVNCDGFFNKKNDKYSFNGTSIVFDNNSKELRWDIFDEKGVVKSNITLTEDKFSFEDVKNDEKKEVISDMMITDAIIDGLRQGGINLDSSYDNGNTNDNGITFPTFNIKNYIRLKKTDSSDGVEFVFGKFGSITDIIINLEYNQGFILQKWKRSVGQPVTYLEYEKGWHNMSKIIDLIKGGGASVLGNQLPDDKLIEKYTKKYLYVNGKRITNMKESPIKVDNSGDCIKIIGLSNSLTEFNVLKKDEKGNKVEIISTDLGEIVVNRENTISVEREFNKQIKKFSNYVRDAIYNENLSELRAAAIKAINERNQMLQNDPSKQKSEVEHTFSGPMRHVWSLQYDYKSQDNLERVVKGMSKDELMRIIKINDTTDTMKVLERHGIGVVSFKKTTENLSQTGSMYIGH